MANSRLCSIPDCGKPARNHRLCLCTAHEKRLIRHGDPLKGGRFRLPKAGNCSVQGCTFDVFAASLCSKHYSRNARHGSPKSGGTDKGALKQWVLDHVGYTGTGCLIWPFSGSSDGQGYGHLYVDGKTVRAHRYMCTLAHGVAPSPSHDAAHSCGQGHTGCIHPQHLRWATRIENVADMVAHGTALRGSKAPWAKLSDDDVRFIRKKSGLIRQKDLAEMFGVSKSLVGMIQQRKRWAYLE